MKIDNSTSHDAKRKKWPKGQYCIYQKGSSCPAGMISGSLLWDDENGVNGSKNFRNGTLPKGVYNHDTKIFFCCQISGSYNVPIELPTDKPFYLLAFRPHCQEVLNTGHIMEFIEYATEDHNNHDKKSFPYPYGADFRNPRIHYCYYYYEVDKPTTSSFSTTADTNATWTTTPSPTRAKTTTTTGISTNTTINVTTIVKTTSTTKPDGTSNSTLSVFHAESTPFTITPSSTTTVEISTTDSTDQPRITGEAEPTDENIVRAARKQQDKTKAVPSYVIPVVFSLLVLMAGVIVLIHYHRKRRRNKIKIEDPGRLSVIYSTVDMKQEINRNNNLLNTGDIIIGNKTTLNRDFQGGGSNTYEEVKETQNPLYNLSTCLSFNIYEELVDVSNGANTGRTQNKNSRKKNNPAYESTEIRNPRRKENPAYESVDGVFK